MAERYLYEAANAERTQHGLNPLRWDENLFRAAHAHAYEMAARESISHQYPGELELGQRGQAAGARFSVIAENVAEASDAPEIHDAWMHSEGHRRNLLDERLTAIGISVIERDGQMYAVQDFERSVESLTFEDQETAVAQLLRSMSPVQVDPSSAEAARQTCTMDTGFAGQRRPWFVMRFTTTELRGLPDELKQHLATGKYHQAAVGACSLPSVTKQFTAYNVAVLLYP